MYQLLRLLGILTLVVSLTTSIITQAATPTKESIRLAEQNELATTQPDGKKLLRRKLSLDYTNSKFETDLNKSQKDAILTSLKKWKLDLPVNNTFTVTSIADLKKNQKVVYMWAVTPNSNWDNSKPYNIEDYEEGDPRFTRTEFNVLLKKSSQGWKATLEQDNELKTELATIPENEVTTQEKNVLFGADKSENVFTDRNEVLIEGNYSSSSSSVSSISSVTSSNSISQINSSSGSTISINNVSSTSSKTIGLLDILFDSPKVSAAWETDYSLPWKSGDQWYVGQQTNGQSWHECETMGPLNSNNSFNVSGCALDVQPYNNASSDVLAPISGVIQRACNDGIQSNLKIGAISMLHLSANSTSYITTQGVSVNKSSKLGSLYPSAINANTIYKQCGVTSGPHLHMKLDGVISNGGNFQFTNFNFLGSANYANKLVTSDN